MTVVAVVVAPFFAAIIIAVVDVVGARRSRSGRGHRGLVVGARDMVVVVYYRRGPLSSLTWLNVAR